MATFVVNVALQNASAKDYTKLKNELKKDHFEDGSHNARSEAYTGSKGLFTRQGIISLKEINEAITKAALKTGKQFSYFVIKNKQPHLI